MSVKPEHLHELLKYCIEFSELMLKDSGDFLPFGASLSPFNKVMAVAADIGEEHPAPVEIIKIMNETFRAQLKSKEILAAAIACNVNIPKQYEPPVGDGLRVHIESDNFHRYIYVPYKLTKRGWLKKTNQVEFFDPIAVEIEPQLVGQAIT